MKKIIVILALAIVLLSGCARESDVASKNISYAADSFQIARRIVFYNSIHKEYMLSIEGLCALDLSRGNVITVTCKTSQNEYKKHYLGLSDNVTYFAEQLESAPVNTYHYKVNFRPQLIIPDIEVKKEKKGEK